MNVFGNTNRSLIKVFLLALVALFAGFGQAGAVGPDGRAKTVHVQTVGVANAPYALPFLPNAAKDGINLAEDFKGQNGKLAANVRVAEPLINEKATKQNILHAIDQLAHKAGPDDLTIVSLAGHGLAVNGEYYFYAYDQTITGKELRAPQRIPGTVVAVVDTCYAEALITKDCPLVILAACKANQTASDDKIGTNGWFTGLLRQALKGQADLDHNGNVEASEVVSFFRGKQGPMTKNGLQSPVLHLPASVNGKLVLSMPITVHAANNVNQPAPNVAGTTYSGQETYSGKLTSIRFQFHQDGRATVILPNGNFQGTWTQNGHQVTVRIQFANGQNVFLGTVYGTDITGMGVNGSSLSPWSFHIAKTN